MQCIKYFNKTFILSLISCFYLHNENSYHISITSTLANSSSLSRNVVAQISLNLSRSKLNIALLRTSNDVVVLFLKMIKQWLHSYESKDYLIFKSNYTKSMNYHDNGFFQSNTTYCSYAAKQNYNFLFQLLLESYKWTTSFVHSITIKHNGLRQVHNFVLLFFSFCMKLESRYKLWHTLTIIVINATKNLVLYYERKNLI